MSATAQLPVSFADIQAAAKRIASAVSRTPCPLSIPLSEATGMHIYCKLEYLQRTGSFKERGARNALLLLTEDQRKRGVIAASAGNHALGLAYHAQLLGIPATVIMPRLAPLTKVLNCKKLGAEVLSHGNNIDEAREFAQGLVQERGLTYINGYNDPAIIAGQGTLGLEIADQVVDLDAVIVPIGGGGLIAGVALALKTLRPAITVIGVGAANVGSYSAARQAGSPVLVSMKQTLADGLAVPRVGDNSFAMAELFLDRYVEVTERQIALAILRLVELEKAVVEGAGAAPLAACLAGLLPELKGKKVVLPLCGGNIDTTVLGRVIEKGLVADGRLIRFTALISDRPGGMARFSTLLAEVGASIVDLGQDRAFSSEDLNLVRVNCLVETKNFEHIEEMKEKLASNGFEVDLPGI